MVMVNQFDWRQRLLRFLACYLLYTLLLALGIVAILIWRTTMITMLAVFNEGSPWNHFLYLVSMLLLGTSVFILVMAAEPYLRNGIHRRQLLKRVTRLVVPVGIAGLVGLLLQELALAMLR